MKLILAALLFLTSLSAFSAQGDEKLICASFYAFYYKKEIEKLPNDKAMHCTMSCYLAVKCPKEEAALIGYLKEFWDIFGPGDADWNDIKANEAGIRFAKKKSKAYCKNQCLKKYPKKPKKK